MSTLEERREARRRRRQQQEEEEDADDTITSPELDTPYNIEKRRQEREDRLQRIAAGFNTINGEDELERRRRERREQRLKTEEGTTETAAEEDPSSRRSRRRRGTEDELDTSTVSEDSSSIRSRRRRNQEDSTPAAAPEPTSEAVPDTSEEDRQREEEAERQRQEAEAARRRAQEEEDRREEEERQRREEEQRRREEEQRRQREEDFADSENSETESSQSDMSSNHSQRDKQEHEQKVEEQMKRLKSLEKDNDLLIEEDKWTKSSGGVPIRRRKSDERGKILSPKEPVRRSITEYSLRAGEDGKCEKLKSFFEEKHEIRVNGDHHDLSKSLPLTKKSSMDDKSPLYDKKKKFEINEQITEHKQDQHKNSTNYQTRVISPGASRLKDIQKKFEHKPSTENSSSRLGRLSASESFLNDQPTVSKDSKKHILDRWKSVTETKNSVARPHSMLSKSMSTSYEYDLHKKGDTIERLTSKFDHNSNETSEKFVKSATLPIQSSAKVSSLTRQWSHTTEENDKNDVKEQKTQRHSVPKVMERWRHSNQTSLDTNSSKALSSETRTRPKSASYEENNKENHSELLSHSEKRKSSVKLEEEERLERERLEEEERQREEAARIMEEQQKKKKGKRKGLGGLSPEKKKMLKDDEYSSSEDEDDPYYKFIDERKGFWNAEKTKVLKERIPHIHNLECMSKGDLQKLCKKLHQQLSNLEEEVYDWEVKIRKQDQEIIQLTLKVNDSKGKFAKPVLKKVNKTESKLNKIAKSTKDKSDFRDNLKSSGQSKFAIDEEGEEKK